MSDINKLTTPEADEEVFELPLDPIWRQAARDAVNEYSYGDIIPKEWINAHLNIRFSDKPMTADQHQSLAFEMLSKIDGWRDELLRKHCRYTVNIRGVGYKIIEPPHQTAAAMTKMQKELRRSISQAMTALVNVNERALSLEDARENADARAKLGAFATLHLKQLERKAKEAEEE